jgi:hypothetical protein
MVGFLAPSMRAALCLVHCGAKLEYLASISTPETIVTFVSSEFATKHARTKYKADGLMASYVGVKRAIFQLLCLFDELGWSGRWSATDARRNPVDSMLVERWRDAYFFDMSRHGAKALGAAVYAFDDLLVMLRRVRDTLPLLDSAACAEGVKSSVRWAPFRLRRDDLGSLYDYHTSQRGGEGAYLQLASMAPCPLDWAFDASGEPLAAELLPARIRVSPSGLFGMSKTEPVPYGCFWLERLSDPEGCFISRLPAWLAELRRAGVALTRDTYVFPSFGPGGHRLLLDDGCGYSSRYAFLKKHGTDADVGAGATPQSARASRMCADADAGVAVETTMRRSGHRKRKTADGYMSPTRERRAGGGRRAPRKQLPAALPDVAPVAQPAVTKVRGLFGRAVMSIRRKIAP